MIEGIWRAFGWPCRAAGATHPWPRLPLRRMAAPGEEAPATHPSGNWLSMNSETPRRPEAGPAAEIRGPLPGAGALPELAVSVRGLTKTYKASGKKIGRAHV